MAAFRWSTVSPQLPPQLAKGTVETSFSAIGSLFAQYVAGYVGSSVENRGKDAEQDAAWSMVELQELLDEWIVECFSDRPIGRPGRSARLPLAAWRAP